MASLLFLLFAVTILTVLALFVFLSRVVFFAPPLATVAVAVVFGVAHGRDAIWIKWFPVGH